MTTVFKCLKFSLVVVILALAISAIASLKNHGVAFADPVTCSQDDDWVGANVQVEIEDSAGNVVGYSSQFDFSVAVSVPVQNQGPPTPPGTPELPNNANPAVPYLNETVDGLDGNGNPYGFGGKITDGSTTDTFASDQIDSSGNTDPCKEQGESTTEPTYDFTNGTNGNLYLNCLGGALNYEYAPGKYEYFPATDSASFTFTAVSVKDEPDGSFTVGSDSISPTLGSGDLNKANYDIRFVYKESPPVNQFHDLADLAAWKNYPDSGNVDRGQLLAFSSGMHNTESGDGPRTSVEFYDYANYQDVSGTRFNSNDWRADPEVVDQGYNNGCMRNNPSNCFDHYFWVRKLAPGAGQGASGVEYMPVYYQVNSDAQPGKLLCFQTAVTPTSTSDSGPNYSNSLCYTINVSLQCGAATVSPNPPQEDQTFNITLGVGPSVGPGPLPTPSQGTMTALIDGVSHPVTYDNSNNAWVVNVNGGLSSVGTNTVDWSFAANNGSGIDSLSGCHNTFNVSALPYLKVFGGDVISGVSSDSIATCYDTTKHGIASYNQGVNGANGPGTTGAGTTIAALATDDIDGFASGQNILDMLNPAPLSFANVNISSSTYGGDYYNQGGGAGCGSEDFYSQAQALKNNPNITFVDLGSTGGTIHKLTLSAGANCQPGQNDVYISTGPVKIDGDITYNIPANTCVSSFPSFELVVKGADINVVAPDPFLSPAVTGVSNLAGLYVSELDPSSGAGGTIDDTGNSKIDICPSGTVDDSKNKCYPDRLLVDGSFVANKIDLYRAYGTLDDASTSATPQDPYAAEEFDNYPYTWLTPGNGQLNPQAITSLPPVY